jgi:hypothetical protein
VKEAAPLPAEMGLRKNLLDSGACYALGLSAQLKCLQRSGTLEPGQKKQIPYG